MKEKLWELIEQSFPTPLIGLIEMFTTMTLYWARVARRLPGQLPLISSIRSLGLDKSQAQHLGLLNAQKNHRYRLLSEQRCRVLGLGQGSA